MHRTGNCFTRTCLLKSRWNSLLNREGITSTALVQKRRGLAFRVRRAACGVPRAACRAHLAERAIFDDHHAPLPHARGQHKAHGHLSHLRSTSTTTTPRHCAHAPRRPSHIPKCGISWLYPCHCLRAGTSASGFAAHLFGQPDRVVTGHWAVRLGATFEYILAPTARRGRQAASAVRSAPTSVRARCRFEPSFVPVPPPLQFRAARYFQSERIASPQKGRQTDPPHLPCRALPRPFCIDIFLVVPLISLTVRACKRRAAKRLAP